MPNIECRACGRPSDEEDFFPASVPGMAFCPLCGERVPVSDEAYGEE